MNVIDTKLKGVKVIEPVAHGDNRGWFMETYNQEAFRAAGLDYTFVQDNQSYSAQKGILRGLHFQNNPWAQAKLVRCTQGAILDVAVDIRKGSETYLQYVAVELSAENKKQLLIPRGFAHGFVTLTQDVMVQYKVDNVYHRESDRGIRYDDPQIGVQWGVDQPILSQKDTSSPLLRDSDANFTVKVLVTGAGGQLGFDMLRKLRAEGYDCLGADRSDFDIVDYDRTRAFVKAYRPDIVVHCAAYTAVNQAESDAERCAEINVKGSENLARVCREIGAKMVYISTDYVYDGSGEKPFCPHDAPAPLSVYGKTKLDGERACAAQTDRLFVIRTSWVFGINGNNFVKTMLKLGKERDCVRVVHDQIGSPTYTPDLADFIFYLMQTERYGTYHCTNEGYCSWYEFAREIFRLSGTDTRVEPIATADYPTPAVRPLNSRLDKQCLIECGYHALPAWQDALARYLREMNV